MNTTKIAYYASTGIFTALIAFGAVMYFVQHDMVAEMFQSLGYPTHIIYPLAVAKLLGLVAIWTRKSELLADLAYAGFFYELILATGAHLVAQDGGFGGALVALVLVVTSYVTQRRMQAAEGATVPGLRDEPQAA